MERTDYVAKAKSLLKKTALVIVPLAMAATATASVGTPTLPTGGYCTISGSASVSCPLGVDPLLSPGLAGLKFFTNGVQTLLPSGSSGSFHQELVMRTSGSFFGVLPNTLPVFYDFTLQADPDVTIDSWDLRFMLFGRYNGSITFSGSGVGTFAAPGLLGLSLDSGSNTLAVQASMDIRGTRTAGGQVSINVPQNGSFDFGATSAPVPEPTTMGIAGAGLALVAWFGRRRNHRAS